MPGAPLSRSDEEFEPSTRRPERGWGVSRAMWVLAICAAVYLIRFAAPVLLPLVIATFLFYALDPVVDFLQRRRVPRLLASVLVMVGLLSGVAATAYSLWPQVDAVITKIPDGAARVRASLRRDRKQAADSPIQRVQEAVKAIDSAAAEAAPEPPKTPGVMRVEVQQPLRTWDWVWSGGVGAVGLAGQTVTILFLTIFLLNENDSFKRKIVNRLRSGHSKRTVAKILDDVATQVERFIWVQALTSAIVAAATTFALWWMGVQQPLVWGLFAGVLNVIPYYGPIAVTAVLSIVGFLQFGSIWQATLVGAVTFVLTSLEGMLLTPYLLTKAASLNPVATFVSIAFWGWAWGVPGIFLAVPLLMAMKSICDHVESLQAVGDLLGE